MLPFFSKKTPEKPFLSLVISDGTVAAAIWNAGPTGAVLVKGSVPVPWNEEAELSVVDASDAALDSLGAETNSVKDILLGLPEQWAAHQSIATDKKHLLKKLTDNLNLKSVGFVITQEAVAALYRDREHTACNALLVFVSKSNVHVISILHGQASESVKVGRSDSLVNDIIEGCARGEFSGLPARILLASQDLTDAQLQQYQQEFHTMTWDQKLFPHPPRVDLVGSAMILEAVSLSGGKEVARALGLLKEGKSGGDELVSAGESEKAESASFGFKPIAEAEEEQEETEPDEIDADKAVDLGITEPVTAKPGILRFLPIFAGVLAVLLVAAGIFYVALTAFTSVTVAAVIHTEPISFNTPLTIDANAAQTDPANNILKATQRSKDITDTAEGISTGTSVIGDKATGPITIYNRTTAGDKTFKAGTIVKLDDNVQYSLDSDVTVPAGTQDTQYVGKASTKVTAVNIGAQSNIAKGVELTVAGYDKASFVATSDDVFAGGTSRNVQVVSDADQKKLADSLFAQLKAKALTAFQGEIAPTENVMLSNDIKVTKKSFSDDIGKEVKSFTLTMTVSTTAIVYTNEDIAAFATERLAAQIPAGAVLQPEQTKIVIESQQPISDTKLMIQATVSSVIVPAFDSKQIAGVLAGKTVTEANDFLHSQHAIDSYTLTFHPGFAASISKALPTQVGKIHVTSTVK